jgi:sugar (pentulose or hexulose) kinase
MGHYLGIDAGTSGMRACVIDQQQRLIAESALPLPPSRIEGDRVEQHATGWWQTCCTLLDALFTDVPASSITALAIDATSASGLLCDHSGLPQTAALMYNDRRARSQAQQLATLRKDQNAATANSSLAKCLWFSENQLITEQSLFRHQADWLTGQFLGNFAYSDENNALKLGYDAVRRQWPDWMQELPCRASMLPDVRPAGSRLGTISSYSQARFGLPAHCLVAAGTTDSTAACLAAGIHQPGEAVTVLGSTLVVKILSERPIFSTEYGIYSHRLGELWLVGGASNSGGAVLKQFFSEPELETLSLAIDPATDSGLDYYPLATPGERFPINEADYPPRITPRPASDSQFLHGLLEGMARIEALGYQRLIELGAPRPVSIRTLGGGAANPVWQRLRERISGIPLQAADYQQAACGAALLALQCSQST